MKVNESIGRTIRRGEVLELVAGFGAMGTALHNAAVRYMHNEGMGSDLALLAEVKARISAHLSVLLREGGLVERVSAGWRISKAGRKALGRWLVDSAAHPELNLDEAPPEAQGAEESSRSDALLESVLGELEELRQGMSNALGIIAKALDGLSVSQRALGGSIEELLRDRSGVPIMAHLRVIDLLRRNGGEKEAPSEVVPR